MLSIAVETRAFIRAALDGDSALASLAVAGGDADTLTAIISPGCKPVDPAPTFDRQVLVELVVRMQRRRWQRWDDFVLGLSPPDEEDWRQIHAVLGVHPECGPGWYDLVLAAAHWIIELGGDPRTGQLKEKFGEMRWYHSGLVGVLGDEIVDAAEHLSEHICEVCGAPGKINRSGWMKTRCGEHEHEHE